MRRVGSANRRWPGAPAGGDETRSDPRGCAARLGVRSTLRSAMPAGRHVAGRVETKGSPGLLWTAAVGWIGPTERAKGGRKESVRHMRGSQVGPGRDPGGNPSGISLASRDRAEIGRT
jgi:hypothetical protein